MASNTSKLFDVTSGNNGTCGTGTLLCNATVGWDGPTGYGTPNATALNTLPVPSDPADDDDGGGVTGGCATGGGTGAGVLLGVALLGLRRRRR